MSSDITFTAGMANQDDADAFNKLSQWCVARGISFNGVIEGTRATVSLSGREDLLEPLIEVLEARKDFETYGI